MWRGPGSSTPMWRQALSFSWLDNILPTQLAEIFIINFGWVLSVFVLLHAISGVARWVVHAPPRDLTRPDERAAQFLVLVFVATVVAVTRFRTLVNPRYVLPAVVLLPLLALLALHALNVRRQLRLLILGLFAALSALSNFRTQDGLSLKLFDSFQFGERRLLDLTAWTHETPSCRDTAAYSPEFTNIAVLLDQALPFALADGRHALALNRHSDWWLIGCVDPRTHRRVVSTPGGLCPTVWSLDEIRRQPVRPPLVYYFEQPGFDDEDEVIGWGRYYRARPARVFSARGYAVTVHEMRLRDDAPDADR